MDSTSHFDLLAETLGHARVLRHLDRASLRTIILSGLDQVLERGRYVIPPDEGVMSQVVCKSAA